MSMRKIRAAAADFFDDRAYLENAEKFREINYKFYILFSEVMAIFLIVLYLSTFFSDYATNLIPIYLFFISISVVELVAVKHQWLKSDRLITGVCCFGIAKAYLFCLFTSVIFNQDGPAVTFHVFLILIPVAFVLKPAVMVEMQTAMTALFCILTIMVKDPEYIWSDIFTVLIFYLISLLLSNQIARVRVNSANMANLAERHSLALEDNQELLNIALKNASMDVWEYDAEKKLIHFSEDVEQRERAVGRNIPESAIRSGYVCEESVEDFRRIFSDAAEGKSISQGDVHVRKISDGSSRWIHIRLVAAKGQQDKRIRYVGTTTDITDQKGLEQQYEEQIRILDSVSEDNLITKGRWNLTTDVQEMAESRSSYALPLRELTTYGEAKEFLLKDVVPESRRQELGNVLNRQNLIDAYSRGEDQYTLKYQRKTNNKDIIWVSMKIRICQRPGSNEMIAFAYSSDITDEVLNQSIVDQLVRDEFEFLGTIAVKTGCSTVRSSKKDIRGKLDSIGAYRVAIDYEESTRMAVVNTVIEEEREEIAGKLQLSHVLKRLSEEPSYLVTFSTVENGKNCRKQLKFIYLDETKEVILYRRTDITKLYEMEQRHLREITESLEQAKKANAAKTDFLSNMSHDMRTPMNGILGLAALMKNKTNVEELQADVDQINLSGRYLLNLINDTLDMNKIESGKLELHQKPMNSEDVFSNILATAELMARDKGVALLLDMPPVVHGQWKTVLADASRIEQIMINIISNAIKYTPAGGTVTLKMETVFMDETRLVDRYTVSDNGIGMKEEFLPHLFEPFTQEGRMNTERQNGTGLGMSIVKQLVDMMDGEITVESRLNEGTKITVELPYRITEALETPKREEAADLSVLSGIHVLLCEDHPLNRQIATRMLEDKGVIVTCAQNGQEGLALFEKEKPGTFDLILMDIRMPVMDGLETTRRIRALAREDAHRIPIIAMTANAYDSDIQTSLEAGMNRHLAKPIEPEKMYQTIAGFFERRV